MPAQYQWSKTPEPYEAAVMPEDVEVDELMEFYERRYVRQYAASVRHLRDRQPPGSWSMLQSLTGCPFLPPRQLRRNVVKSKNVRSHGCVAAHRDVEEEEYWSAVESHEVWAAEKLKAEKAVAAVEAAQRKAQEQVKKLQELKLKKEMEATEKWAEEEQLAREVEEWRIVEERRIAAEKQAAEKKKKMAAMEAEKKRLAEIESEAA
ncbi:hypothetical protein IW261DRAFT_1567319 [Armillaria novae-zelandiae]|uniref:Uncharacterized protein n=1 Tax=Armillaria novae-zelandiae TaxID=153914 RepID=A0AA39P1W8_9AGAR|nr:hypothetical protein IW261DRAFT_1567319 [Armillaria novae-zelandiae]